MEGPGDDVHSISACWVAIEENSDKPKEDNKSIFSKINSFELMNDRQAYGEFIAETVPGRGATAEVSHKTIASHVSFYAGVLEDALNEYSTRSRPTAMAALNSITGFNFIITRVFATKVGHPSPSAVAKADSLRKLQKVYEFMGNIMQTELDTEVRACMDELHLELAKATRRQTTASRLQKDVADLADVFGAEAKPEPSFQERQAIRSMQQAKLANMLQEEAFISDNETKFAFLFTLSDALLPARPETMQYLKYGHPSAPSLQTIPAEERFFIHFREQRGAFNIVQRENKTGRNLATEVPPELTDMVKLYLDAIDPGPVFPRKVRAGTPAQSLAKSQFQTLLIDGFASIGLEGATIMNARHAVANHIASTAITGSSIQQAYAKGMNTSIKCLFGTVPTCMVRSTAGSGARAYATKLTDVAQAFPAVQHHRHLIFKRPYEALVVVRVRQHFEVGKIVATTSNDATAIILEMDADRRSHAMPTEEEARAVRVPLGDATKAQLAGALAPTFSNGVYDINPTIVEGAIRASDLKSVRAYKATEMGCEQGQIVLMEDGGVAEVRSSEAAPLVVLPYRQIANDSYTTEWILEAHSAVIAVARNKVSVAVDWGITASGTVVIKKK
jgi:hypothetical protein